jgi:putative DNA primase/helicase
LNKGKPTAVWIYHDSDGTEAFRVARFDGPDGKTYRPIHPTADGWRIGDPAGKLPLYNLPALAGAGRVVIGEGEKAVTAVCGLGLVGTTSAHGAGSAGKSDWRPLAGKDVVILPDHDGPGERYAQEVTAELAKLTPRPTVKIVRLPDLWRTAEPIPAKGDLVEWLDRGVPDSWEPPRCRGELERAADAAPPIDLDPHEAHEPQAEADPTGASAPLDWPDRPRPVRGELRPVPGLEPAMIPGPLRGWLSDIAERVSCPLEFPTVGALVGVALVVGRKVAFRPKRHDDWAVVPNLWGAIIGRPGELKSPALTEATKPLRRLEADARDRHARAVADFRADALVVSAQADTAKQALKSAAKAKKPKDVLDALARDALAATPAGPILKRYTTSDPTVEALGELLRDNPAGVGLIRDELTGWLRSFDREDRACDRAFYLEAWNGNGPAFTYDRIGRGTILIPSPCVSILGGMQPGPLRALLRRAVRGGEADDGLVSRFQLLVWPDPPGQWRNVDRWPDTALKNRAYGVFQALDAMTPESVGAAPDEDGGPPFLRFDPDAQDVFDSWRTGLEARLRTPDESPLVESHLSKYRSLMPSLAGLFHLIEVTDGAGPGPVGIGSAVAAVAWCDYTPRG